MTPFSPPRTYYPFRIVYPSRRILFVPAVCRIPGIRSVGRGFWLSPFFPPPQFRTIEFFPFPRGNRLTLKIFFSPKRCGSTPWRTRAQLKRRDSPPLFFFCGNERFTYGLPPPFFPFARRIVPFSPLAPFAHPFLPGTLSALFLKLREVVRFYPGSR